MNAEETAIAHAVPRFTSRGTMLIAAAVAAFLLLVAGTSVAQTSAPFHGTVASRDGKRNTLTVNGNAGPAMPAMTMEYEVRGARVDALPPDGSRVSAMLHEENGAYWLTDVTLDPGQSHDRVIVGADAGVSDLLMRQASGTSMDPARAPMSMAMFARGDWMLMLHAVAFVNGTEQSGPRGASRIFSTNWAMGSAQRRLGIGQLSFRAMLSLEPLTVGKSYPELFQTGETIDGRPIVDAQHAHDLFMELAAEYAFPVGNGIGYVYAAPVGDPALGPVAYPHRASAAELPQAPLGHHLEDSTHIADSVVTIGAQRGRFGIAASGFHGREPDENRWDIDRGAIDSWSMRATFDPSPAWTAQISTGHLRHPEAVEEGDVQRTTASVSWTVASGFGRWDSTVIAGRNSRSGHRSTSGFLAETRGDLSPKDSITGRVELVDKDELFANDPLPSADRIHRITAWTAGYSRLMREGRRIDLRLGANATVYRQPESIRPFYGSHPHSLLLFLRVGVRAAASGA